MGSALDSKAMRRWALAHKAKRAAKRSEKTSGFRTRPAIVPKRGKAVPVSGAFVVVVMAYNRPADLLRLLADIRSYAAPFTVRVEVHDDASTADMTVVRAYCAAQRWSFVQAAQRGGCPAFARRVWSILGSATKRSKPGDLVVLLQDDMRLGSRFFLRLARAWALMPTQPALLVPYRDGRWGRPQWTAIAPKAVGPYYQLGWTDCSFVTTVAFLRTLLLEPPRVSAERWSKNPGASSGLGEHLSHRLVKLGVPVYALRSSLIAHVGNDSSLMHPKERTRHPLENVKFVDGEGMHAAMIRREPIIAMVASYAPRRAMLARVIATLAPQVDEIRVYLNDYPDVPGYLLAEKRCRIVVGRSQDHGVRGDGGKFFFFPQVQGYVLTCDDDILYPPNYARYLVTKVEQYGRRRIITCHGAILPGKLDSYFRNRTVLSCRQRIAADRAVHVPGTGVTAVHTQTLRIDPKRDFPTGFMADVHLAVAAFRQKVGITVVAHAKNWIREVAPTNQDTLYRKHSHSDGPQTRALLEICGGAR